MHQIEEILQKMTLAEKARLCTGATHWKTVAMPQYGVPSLVMADGTSGLRLQQGSEDKEENDLYENVMFFSFDSEEALARTIPSTCYPAGSALACSWNPELAREVGAAIAEECKAQGVGMLLGPGMNLRRHPLAGRGFEYYSEDPALSGEMAAGMVEGIQSGGVAACIKHFACNNADYKRTWIDSVVEPRALHEIYLAGFERAVRKARPCAVMGAYNKVNGVQACESEELLTHILREQWGFDGLVMSDWVAVKNSKEAFRAGLNFQMPPSKSCVDALVAGVEDGSIPAERLDESCRQILKLVLHYSKEGKERPQVDWQAHHQLARKAAAQCAVLLKNDGVLPLGPGVKKVAVLGNLAKKPQFNGTGCAAINARCPDIPFDELAALAAPGCQLQFVPGYTADYRTDPALLAEAAKVAAEAEVALVFAGAFLPPEDDDFNRKTMALEPATEALVEAVAAVQPNTVVLLYNGESVAMPWIDRVAGVLDLWFSGEGSGRAAAEIVWGLQNPSGRLPVTLPKRLEDTPAYLNFPGAGDSHFYCEGIYAGYRYYDKKRVEPLYPFGYGLSYTDFAYSEPRLSTRELALPGRVCFSCQVENTGSMAGAEVVQLYLRDRCSKLPRPERELKAFCRVELAPGEKKRVELWLDSRDFCYYDPACGWVADSGEYLLQVGPHSRDIRLEERLQLVSDRAAPFAMTTDTHYTDLLENPTARRVFYDYLVEKGLLLPEQIGPALDEHFKVIFWGMAQHLDGATGDRFTPAMAEELTEKINAALAAER